MALQNSRRTDSYSHQRTSPALVSGLRSGTRELHTAAERSGFISELLCGRGTIAGYALLLRNLLPAYVAMESILFSRMHIPEYEAIANPGIFRQFAIESDLTAIVGPGWPLAVPLLPAAERYAERIRHVGGDGDLRWLGHAYTRYLGDLSGGRILKRVLANTLTLRDDALRFYEFSEIDGIDNFKLQYLAALDNLAHGQIIGPIVREARRAFRLNIELSKAVATDIIRCTA
jgi:heme oxygenase